jgi:hypothetical protein
MMNGETAQDSNACRADRYIEPLADQHDAAPNGIRRGMVGLTASPTAVGQTNMRMAVA